MFFSLQIQAQFVEKPFRHLVEKERVAALNRLLKQALADTGNYDIKFHRLTLNPSLTTRDLTGEVMTYFVPNQNMTTMEFDFNDQMTVDNVVWHNQNLTFLQQDNRLIINLSQTLPAGSIDSVKISYQGVVPDTGLSSYTVSTHGNNVPVVWTLSEPYGARDWWPCKQDLNDKIDSVDVIINYPQTVGGETMTAVSNGLLTSETVSNNTKTSVWKHRYPIAAYLIAFAVTNYDKFTINAGINQSFPIDNYVYPENLSTAQTNTASHLDVMNYFENTFGAYPFNQEKYGQIQFGWGGGMEHQTATFLVSYQRWLAAHELAHQWFGDALTCGSWHDIWLNEGFATYSEALTREALDGQAAFDSWKENVTNDITSMPGGSVYVQDTTDVWRIFNSRLSYHKGAMALNMLRLKLTDTDFFQAIGNYVNNHKFQYVLTDDLRQELESQSGQNLTEFFNDWIYGEGYPTYNITVTRIGSGLYDVLVNQTTSHTSVDFFEMTLPFKFTGNAGNTYETILDNTSNGQHFTVNTGFEATNVEFDAHNDIVKGQTSLNTILAVDILNDTDIKMFPNPAQNFLNIYNNDINIRKVTILTPNGQELLAVSQNFQRIDVNDLKKGLYIVKIETDKGIYVKKMIKK